MRRLTAPALAAFFVLLCSTGVAVASHYPVEVVPFIEAEHKASFAKEKIVDTDELLEALLTPKRRKAMATRIGIDEKVLLDYVHTCDLLRLRGVGPKMAKLLRLSGVPGIKTLRGEKPEPLLERLRATNKKHGVSEILPQADTIKDWIHQARNLKIIVE